MQLSCVGECVHLNTNFYCDSSSPPSPPLTHFISGSTGPEGNNVYIHSILILPWPCCVLSFCSCYSCARLWYYYISSTYICHITTHFTLWFGNHSIFSSQSISTAKIPRHTCGCQKWWTRKVFLLSNKPRCMAAIVVQPGPRWAMITQMFTTK